MNDVPAKAAAQAAASVDVPVSLMPTEAQRSGKSEWIEITKALGVLLLVNLHVWRASGEPFPMFVADMIALFRMPMFFVLSGFLYMPAGRFALFEKRLATLVLPYVAYLVLVFVMDLIFSAYQAGGMPDVGMKDMVRLVLGGAYLVDIYGVFWFMTCLFFTQLLYNEMILLFGGPLKRNFVIAVLGLLVLGYVISWTLQPVALPLALGVVPVGVGLFWVGHLLRNLKPSNGLMAVVAVVVVGGSFLLAYNGVQFEMDMKYAKFGPFILGLLLASVMTWVIFMLSMHLGRSSALMRLLYPFSAAVMPIIFLHQFIHFSLRRVGVDDELTILFFAFAVPIAIWFLFRRVGAFKVAFLAEGLPKGWLEELLGPIPALVKGRRA